MQPPAMQKHHRDDRKNDHGSLIGVAGCDFRVVRGNQRELVQELYKLVGAQAVLEQKHEAIGGDQHPGDHGRVAGGDSFPDRDHLRLLECWSRPDNRSCLSASCRHCGCWA